MRGSAEDFGSLQSVTSAPTAWGHSTHAELSGRGLPSLHDGCTAHFHPQPNLEGHVRFQSFYSLFHAENVNQLVLLYVMLLMRLTLVREELDRDHQPIAHGPVSSHWRVTTFDHNLCLGSNQLLHGDRFHTTRLSPCVIQGAILIKTTARWKPFP